ncbi:kinase-like domain-containing protein [Suillus cothurnatus]|nr:kinase-like domain-containing protein [Suillus cothurnatus]
MDLTMDEYYQLHDDMELRIVYTFRTFGWTKIYTRTMLISIITWEQFSEVVVSEVNILRSIQHPHIVQLIETIETRKWIYVTMELIEGGNLSQFLEQNGVMCFLWTAEPQASQASWDICCAMQYLHDHGIAHHDLKPKNVLISSTAPLAVKVADISLAESFMDGTFLHSMCGTPNFMAPEVWLKVEESQYGCLVDSWSMGVMLFTMFALDIPFQLADDDINSYPQFIQSRKIQWEWLRVNTNWLVIDLNARLAFDKAMMHPWFTYLGLLRQPSIISISSEVEVKRMLLCDTDIDEP